MGMEKDRHIKALDNWNAKAKAEQIVCPACGALIQHDDREVYAEKGMCGACDNTLKTDD
jgi:ribosomal protein S27AE